MFTLFTPSAQRLRRFVDSQSMVPFTYASVGATNATPPEGYDVDHYRVELGRGEATFRAACEALRAWKQFDLGWVFATSPSNVATSRIVVVTARALGVWVSNAARIAYVIDKPRQFGFAYGTLRRHVETGEERFLVDWSRDDVVYYDILAFSRPRHPLARLGYPLMRRFQRRFGRDSCAAMQRAVGNLLRAESSVSPAATAAISISTPSEATTAKSKAPAAPLPQSEPAKKRAAAKSKSATSSKSKKKSRRRR